MTYDSRHVASSDRYGQPSRLERLGGCLGRLVGEGPPRRILRAGFRWILRFAGRGSLRSVLPGGEVVRIAPGYRYVTWNPVEYEAFRPVLRPGDTALDVGANVGAYTVLFGIWVGERGRVFAFEPATGARAGLEEHIALNGLGGRVQVQPDAVSDRVGSAGFVSEGAQGTNHLVWRGAVSDTESAVAVPTITIDAFCEQRTLRPKLIKIDVEGAELAVLRGARRTIAAMDADAAVFVELHPRAWIAMGLTLDDVRAELASQRLHLAPLRPGVSPWELDGECVRLERD